MEERGMNSQPFDHVWYWKGSPWRPIYRKGQHCRILVRSLRMNSILVEFEDGFRTNTSRYAVRKIEDEKRSNFGVAATE
jgi:hypothetical protein